MKIRKYIVLFGLIWLLNSLLSAYEDENMGEIRGRVVYVHDYTAYLTIESFGVNYFKLIAVDFKEKKVLWEVKAKGWITNCFPVSNNSFVTIENDCLVSHNILNGEVNWDKDLRIITPKQEDKKIYFFTRENPLPADSSFWYLTFLANPSCGIVFRQDYEAHYDLVAAGEKDWLRIDLDKGKCIDSGLHELIECGINYALVRDDDNFFLLNQKGLTKLDIKKKKLFLETLNSYDYSLLGQRQRFARPIRVPNLNDSNKLLIFNPKKNLMKIVAIRNNTDYQCNSGWARKHVVYFSECIRSDAMGSNIDKTEHKKPLWIEIYDLDGNRIRRREENLGNWLSYEGQCQNGDIFFEVTETDNQRCARIRRYSMPALSLISEYKLENIEGFQNSVITEVEGMAVLSVSDKNLFNAKHFLKQKNAIHAFRFRFINLNTQQEYWTFAPDVSAKVIKEN
jgi:hypothetical protein